MMTIKKKQQLLKAVWSNLLLLFAAVLFLTALLIYDNASNNVSSAYLWLLSLATLGIFATRKYYAQLKVYFHSIVSDRFFLVILIAHTFVVFFLIGSYPYVAVGDQVREIGTHAVGIDMGADVFGAGSYEGYGKIVSFTGYLSSHVFGFNQYTVRVPTAIMSIFTMIALYILVRKHINKNTALLALVILSSTSTFLYFSRIMFNIVEATCLSIILIDFALRAKQNSKWYFPLGIVSGFSLTAYVSVRLFIVIAGVIAVVNHKQVIFNFKKYSVVGKSSLKFALGLIAGLGPHLLNLPGLLNRTGTGSFVFDKPFFTGYSFIEKVQYLFDTYYFSLLSQFVNSVETNIFYWSKTALINLPFSILIVFGLTHCTTKPKYRNSLIITCVFIFFTAPIFNQVLPGQIGEEQRMLSSLPFLVVIAAYGGAHLYISIKNKYKKVAALTVIAISQIALYTVFFTERRVDYLYQGDYVFEFMAQYAMSDENNTSVLIVASNSGVPMHYVEKLYYMSYKSEKEILHAWSMQQAYEQLRAQLIISDVELFELDQNQYTRSEINVNCKQNNILVPNYLCSPTFLGGSYNVYTYQKR